MNSIILKPKIFVICPRILQLDSYQNFCISNPRTYFALIWLKDLIRRKFVVAIYFRSNSRFLFPSFESWREEQGTGEGGSETILWRALVPEGLTKALLARSPWTRLLLKARRRLAIPIPGTNYTSLSSVSASSFYLTQAYRKKCRRKNIISFIFFLSVKVATVENINKKIAAFWISEAIFSKKELIECSFEELKLFHQMSKMIQLDILSEFLKRKRKKKTALKINDI